MSTGEAVSGRSETVQTIEFSWGYDREEGEQDRLVIQTPAQCDQALATRSEHAFVFKIQTAP